MARPKTQGKSRRGLPSHLTPGNPGNSGGKPGRSGRPPEAFKAFLGKLRTDRKFHNALAKAARDPSSRGFGAALKMLSDYDEDKPAERRELSGRLEISVKMTREGRRRTAG